jgi:hypothetical protein
MGASIIRHAPAVDFCLRTSSFPGPRVARDGGYACFQRMPVILGNRHDQLRPALLLLLLPTLDMAD